MNSHIEISNKVRFNNKDTLRIAPGGKLNLELDLIKPIDIAFYVLQEGMQALNRAMLQISDNDSILMEIGGGNHDVNGSEWQKVGPFNLAPGLHKMVLRSLPSERDDDSQTGYFYIAEVTLGEQIVSPQSMLDSQVERAPGTTLDDSQDLYFTSFEEDCDKYFLKCIPWIEDWGPLLNEPQRSSTYHLSGKHSCQFNQSFFGDWRASYIQTAAIPIPQNTDSVTFSGWFNAENALVEVKYKIYLDMYEKKSGTFSFEGSYGNNDVWEQKTVSLHTGTHTTFSCYLQLETISEAPYSVWLDDLLVEFTPILPKIEKLIVVNSFSEVSALNGETGEKVWSFFTSYGEMCSSPALVNGVAYFGDGQIDEGNVYALNVRTGKKLWYTELYAGITSTPQVLNQVVYAFTATGYIYALSSIDGTELWNIKVINLSPGEYALSFSSIIAGSTLYISSDKGIYSIDLEQKNINWSVEGSFTYAAFAENLLFVGSPDRTFFAFDARTGDQHWAFDAKSQIYTMPIVMGGLVVFGSDACIVYCLHGFTGEQIWSLSNPDLTLRSLAIDGNRLYFCTTGETEFELLAYDFTIDDLQWNFHEAWSYSGQGDVNVSPLVYGDILYLNAVTTTSALNVTDGSAAWVYSFNEELASSPVVAILDPLKDTSRRYDQYCYLTTHNAFANTQAGWFYAQQDIDIIPQLDDGVRALMLDLHKKQIQDVDEVVYCHESCSYSWFIAPFTPYRLLRDDLMNIKAWMANNPLEVVTLILEQRVGSSGDDHALLQRAFTDAGITDMIFYADRENRGTHSSWNVDTEGWPPLSWMITNGKRLVVFSDWDTTVYDPTKADGFPWVWQYVVENPYGTDSLTSGCKARTGSEPICDSSISLFIMNHQLDFSQNYYTDAARIITVYDGVNDFYKIMTTAGTCSKICTDFERLPNFLSVDHYQIGDNGGPRKALEFLNYRWAQRSAKQKRKWDDEQ